MARATTERNALMRAAIASLALHLVAVPLFARAGDPSGSGTARENALANETVRVARLTFDRRGPSRRRESAGTDGTAKRVITVVSNATHAKHATTERLSPKRNEHPIRTTSATIATPRAARTDASHDGASVAGTRAHHAATHAVAHRMARGAIAIVLATPAPERNEPPDPTAGPTLAPEPAVATTPGDAARPPASASHESSAPQIVVAARDGESPPGGWGQSFAKPLVADEAMLATLHARYRGVRSIAIEVDATGHATHVAIPENVTGDSRAELARTLLALRYVPAECNGLRCVGTLQLAL